MGLNDQISSARELQHYGNNYEERRERGYYRDDNPYRRGYERDGERPLLSDRRRVRSLPNKNAAFGPRFFGIRIRLLVWEMRIGLGVRQRGRAALA